MNARIGGFYAAAALAAAALGVAWRPVGLGLLWPAAALGAVAAGYLGLGPGVYRKRPDGRAPLLARALLSPAFLGQYLSWRHYSQQCRAWDAAAPGVCIGRQLTDAEAARAVREAGVSAVLDLTAEFTAPRAFREEGVNYRNLPLLDLTAPGVAQLHGAVRFIEDQRAGGGTVYVHCKAGYSRSAAVVGAWLLASGQAASVDEAVARLRAVRPTLVVRPEARAALANFFLALRPPNPYQPAA